MLGYGISVHDTHVVNTFRPLRPEVSDEEISLRLSYILQRGPFEIVLPSVHGANCVYFVVVTHVHGGEGLDRKVDDPIIQLDMPRRDEAFLLAIEGVEDVKCHNTSISMFR